MKRKISTIVLAIGIAGHVPANHHMDDCLLTLCVAALVAPKSSDRLAALKSPSFVSPSSTSKRKH